jgi:hypothetical protein
MQISCLIVITIHVRLWPYLENYNLFNLVDAVLLTTLAIISIIAGQITNSISENAKDKMVILVDVLAYIPLVYLLGLALYLFFSWILPKLRGPPNEQSLQNLGNDDHPDPEIII